jgi:putative ABC transport system permease protein
MKLKRGRFFTSGDIEKAPPVAIVNEAMARRFWQGGEALGRRIVIRNEQFAREIIGVVSDVRHFGLDREAQPEMYAPFEQYVIDVMPMVIRVKSDPARFAGAVREQARAVDPTVAIAGVAPMRELLSDSLAQRRFTALLLGVFAAVATLLASAGVYGVMAYSGASRAREIGVRLALGAQRGEVLRLLLKQGMKLASVGVTIGLIASLALMRLLEGLLFGVSATDPIVFAACAAALAFVGAHRELDPGPRRDQGQPARCRAHRRLTPAATSRLHRQGASPGAGAANYHERRRVEVARVEARRG